MGVASSKSVPPTGRVDGEPVEFAYDCSSGGQLNYRSLRNAETKTIDGASIIGVARIPGASSEHRSILFVEGEIQAPEGKADHTPPIFQSVVAHNLPRDFVEDYDIRYPAYTAKARQGKEEVAGKDVPPTHIIISTKSGVGLADSFYKNSVQHYLARVGLREGIDYVVHTTKSAHTIMELTSSIFCPRANQGLNQRIVLVSGDGGVVDTINALSSCPAAEKYTPPSIAILPLGTGNALAHSIGITKDGTLGLATLARGAPARLPIFNVRFSPGARLLVDEASREEHLPSDARGNPTLYGAVVCSWGVHAGLVGDSDTAEYRKYGVERFAMAAKEALYPSDGSEPHHYQGKVSVRRTGSKVWEEIPRKEHMYVLATMVSNLEKSFTISPKSKSLDGQLRLVHFGPMSGDEAMRIMHLAYQDGKHVTDPAVGYEDIDGLRIEFDGRVEDGRWRRICVDGKIIRVEKDGWIEVCKETRHIVDVLRMVQ